MITAGMQSGNILAFTIAIKNGDAIRSLKQFTATVTGSQSAMNRHVMQSTQASQRAITQTVLQATQTRNTAVFNASAASHRRLAAEEQRHQKELEAIRTRKARESAASYIRMFGDSAKQEFKLDANRRRLKQMADRDANVYEIRELELMSRRIREKREETASKIADGAERARKERIRKEREDAREVERQSRERAAVERRRLAEQRALTMTQSRNEARFLSGQDQASESLNGLVESLSRAARGFAYLGLVGEENTQKILNGLLMVHGATDMFMGLGRAVHFGRRFGRARAAMTAARAAGATGAGMGGVGAFGAGAGVFGLGTTGTIAGGAALVAGAAFGGMGIYQANTRGIPVGGAWDSVGTWMANQATANRRWAGRNNLPFMDLTGYVPEIGVGRGAQSSSTVTEIMDPDALARAEARHMGYRAMDHQRRQAFQRALLENSFSRSSATFGDVRAMFHRTPFDMMGGTVASISDALAGFGVRRNLISDLAGNAIRQNEADGELRKAAVGSAQEIEVKQRLLEIDKERKQIIEQMSQETATIVNLTQRQADIAKSRLQGGQMSFGMMDRRDQQRLINIDNQVKARGVESLSPQQFREYASIPTADVQELVKKEAVRRAEMQGYSTRFGGAEGAAIAEAGRVEEAERAKVAKALKDSGIDVAPERLADMFTGALRLVNEKIKKAEERLATEIQAIQQGQETQKKNEEEAKKVARQMNISQRTYVA